MNSARKTKSEGWYKLVTLFVAISIAVYLLEKKYEEAYEGAYPEVASRIQAEFTFRPNAVEIRLEAEPPGGPVAVFAWPYGDWQRAWVLLPAPAEVTVEYGPLSQGDRDPEPFTTYTAFLADPPDPAVPAVARFSGGVELLGVEVTPVDVDTPPPVGGIRVRVRWRATAPLEEDYTVFLHYVRDGERIAQADSRPAGGYYPTTVWRPGDVINDDHCVEGIDALLPGHDRLVIGFWQPESGAVLHLLDEAGNPAGDWIEVPADGY